MFCSRVLVRSALIVLLGNLLINSPAVCSNSSDPLPQYSVFEQAFEVKAAYENPFDSSSVKVDAVFTSEGGEAVTVPCFFDGESGWKVRYTPSKPGRYFYTVRAVTPKESVEAVSGIFEAEAQQQRGFVRVGANTKRHFVFDNGDSYFPLGENMGWVHPPVAETWRSYFDECAKSGVNWVRIWISPIGSTELEWMPQGDRYHGLGKYDLNNARLLDEVFQAAQERGIYIQPVINHHGQYSDKTNPMWDSNPYNIKNGGFLEKPGDFFTHPEAQRHYLDRLRYLVARWGYSTHLLAWEFWNEVDLTGEYDRAIVKAWHERMIPRLREIDPYDHLITTSAASDHAMAHNIEGLDYTQTHAYINSIISKVMETSKQAIEEQPEKPHFFGELSYDYRGPNRGDKEGVILHNQLWASVHSADAGTAMTWWWDNWVRPYNLYPHFLRISQYIEGVHWDRENLKPMPARVEQRPGNLCDLMIQPTRGWEKTNQAVFRIAPDGRVENADQIPSFIFGQSHRDLAPNPTFEVETSRPSEFGLQIQRVARAGAQLKIEINGEQVYERGFASQEKDSTMGEEGRVSVPVPAGKNRITVKNTGPDWLTVQHYWVTDSAQRPVAYARGGEGRILVWVHDTPHQFALLEGYNRYKPTEPTTITLPSVHEGEYNLEQFDPYTGDLKPLPVLRVSADGLKFEVPSFTKDTAFRLMKR